MFSNRRQFLKNLGVVASGLMIFKNVQAEEKRRAKKSDSSSGGGAGGDLALPMVKPGEGMAASVHYTLDHKDVKDAALKADRQGVKFEQQHCASCMLYTKVGNKDGGEVGKCTLFAGSLVKSTAWCGSWSKKA